MTMREQFDKWWWGYRGFPDAHDGTAWDAWQAAYRAGQVEMKERAAKVADKRQGVPAMAIAMDIRALPVDAD